MDMKASEYLGGIYAISVIGVGTYYGESTNIPRRWATHRRHLSRGRHANFRLQAAWKSLGPRAFNFLVLQQSKELTLNKSLRLMLELHYINQDVTCLNVRDGHDQPITQASLPDRPYYRNRLVLLKRHNRSSLVRIYDDGGNLLGVETVQGKFRLGTFYSGEKCELTRKTTRGWKKTGN